MKKTIIAILQLQLITPTLPAAVPLRWTVETSRVQPAVFEAYQGETLTFEAALQSHGKPLAAPVNYSFFWQTNGMGSTYWEAPAQRGSGVSPLVGDTNVLFATWLPAYDVGARVYNCFIGSPSNIYHAAFQLRLRPSPGALPNALPLPTPVIDFARVKVINPPWGSGGGGGCDTNAVDILANSAVVTNAITVATTNRVAALETHVENTDNPHGVTAEQVGALSILPEKSDEIIFNWADTWGTAIRLYTPYYETGIGLSVGSVGGQLLNYHDNTYDWYDFPIGESGTLALKRDISAAISATNPTFSNAVLAVGLNIDTNSVAVLNEIADTFGGFPIEGTATTVGGLLAALAAAAAWPKKNKVGSFKSVGGATATVENGVAKLDDFFTNSNSLLISTIAANSARLALDEDGEIIVTMNTED